MIAVIQRVKRATITIDGHIHASIGRGLFVLVGLGRDDDKRDIEYMVGKIERLRVFEDDNGRMNLCVRDVGGELAVVSEFTLLGDIHRGNRPSFTRAMPVEEARKLWPAVRQHFVDTGIPCAFGRFQAMMDCSTVNDGPVTLLLDSASVHR